MVASFTPRQITDIIQFQPSTRWLTFEGNLAAQPGQFVMAWLPGVDEAPFSIASMDPFGLLVVDVGPFSHALHQLTVGDRVWFKGPLGKGFVLDGKKHLLVGGGYGAAPLLPLATLARTGGSDVHLCLGAQTEVGLLLIDQFKDLGCKVSLTTEDGSLGARGLVTDIIDSILLQEKFDALYACGPVGLLTVLVGLARTHRLPYQLSWEAHMRCGMGLCGSCEVPNEYDPALPPGWLACFDGPVFANLNNYDESGS